MSPNLESKLAELVYQLTLLVIEFRQVIKEGRGKK